MREQIGGTAVCGARQRVPHNPVRQERLLARLVDRTKGVNSHVCFW